MIDPHSPGQDPVTLEDDITLAELWPLTAFPRRPIVLQRDPEATARLMATIDRVLGV